MIVKEAKRIRNELNMVEGITFKVKSKRTKTPKIEIQITNIDENHIKEEINGYGLDCLLKEETIKQIIAATNKNQEKDQYDNYNYLVYIYTNYNGDGYGDWTHWVAYTHY